jgi:hypothetical protein
MRRISTPPEPPIFKEANFDLTRSSVYLGFHSQLLDHAHRFRITTLVQTPGYSVTSNRGAWTSSRALRLPIPPPFERDTPA